MQVNSGIENRDFATARDEILRQLDACRQGDITEPELESARKTTVTNWRAMLDDPLALERYWLGQGGRYADRARGPHPANRSCYARAGGRRGASDHASTWYTL